MFDREKPKEPVLPFLVNAQSVAFFTDYPIPGQLTGKSIIVHGKITQGQPLTIAQRLKLFFGITW